MRVQAKRLECVAEKQDVPAMRVIEGLHPQVIARAEKLPARGVPDRKCEVAAQVMHAPAAPPRVRMGDEFGIAPGVERLAAGRIQFGEEPRAVVEAAARIHTASATLHG